MRRPRLDFRPVCGVACRRDPARSGCTGARRRAPEVCASLSCLLLALLLSPVPARAWQPNTMRLGTVELHPFFATEFTYNSNISLTREEVPDWVFQEAPGLTLQWERLQAPQHKPRLASPHGVSLSFLHDLYLAWVEPRVETGFLGRRRPGVATAAFGGEGALLRSLKFRRYSLELTYEPRFVQLLDHPEFNAVDHRVAFTGDVRFPGGLYLRLDDSFESSTAINTYRNEVVNFSARQRAAGIGYHTNLLSFAAGYNFYADYAIWVSYLYQLFFVRDFAADQALPGLTLPPLLSTQWRGIDPGTLGMGLHNAQIYLAKQLWRKTTFSVGYVLGVVEGNLQDFGLAGSAFGFLLPFEARLSRDPRDAVFHEVRAGFQRTLTARATLLGWQVPRTAIEGIFAYQWREFPPLELQVDAAGSPLLRVRWQRKDFDEFLVKLKLSSELRERTRLLLSLSRYPQEALGGSGNVVINWEAGLSLDQVFRRKWNLNAQGAVRYGEHLAETSGERHYLDYQARAGLGYQIQQWLQARLNYEFLARQGDFDYNAFRSHRAQFRVAVSF